MTRPKKPLNLRLAAIYHFFIWGLTAGSLTAAPLLWRVEGPRPSFLFGTVHSAESPAATIPPAVFTALDSCTSFHPEIELSPDLPAQMAARLFDPDTPDLQGAVSPDLWRRVQAAGAKLGLPEELLHRLTPGLAALLFAEPPGETEIMATVDGQLYQRSEDRGLTIVALESVDEQLDLFNHLTRPQALGLLHESLDDFEAGHPQFARLLAAYAAGDEGKLAAVVAEDFKNPSVRALAEPLLYQRNRLMTDRAEPSLRRDGAFVAVGAAHLVSPRSIIAILRAQGFKISRVRRSPTLTHFGAISARCASDDDATSSACGACACSSSGGVFSSDYP